MSEDAELSPIKRRALRILGSRQLSSHEMEKRLLNKGEPAEDAIETVKWLEDMGAINDEEYASSIVRHYISKGYGLARIRDELYRRGIPREMWDGALSEIEGIDDSVYQYLAKKLGGSHDKTEIRRATDALCRRGFSYEEVCTAIARHLENTEETEDMGE